MRVFEVNASNAGDFQSGICELEKNSRYPLGNEFFKISHGHDYFAFFRRLGKLRYYVLADDRQVAVVGAGVLRSLPCARRGGRRKAWYICDLKVHLDYRGQHLPLKLLGRVFLLNYMRCPRGYAISMDPGDGSPNRVLRLLQRFRWLPFRLATRLHIFSLSCDQVRQSRDFIEDALGKITFLSLRGKKDLILEGTGEPLPVLHMQYGGCGEYGTAEPEPGFAHMFCVPEGDQLLATLQAKKIFPIAQASVIAHGMGDTDWRFILTSDI
jgi:hypothetical protein